MYYFQKESVPSVLLADAVWYGSLRGGVEMGGGGDAEFKTTASRWGIKGTSEVSEGLSAMYKFETRVGSGTMSQDTNQLYVGLSGGFGNLMLGKFHNAAYLAGGIRDIGNWYSSGDVNTKAGNTVSYGYAAETFKLQADVIMDGRDTGGAVDESQFGLAVNLGDIGTVAIGYEKAENAITDKDMKGDAIVVTPHGTLARDGTKITGAEDLVWRYSNGHVAMVRDVKMKSNYMVVDVVQTESDTADIKVDKDGLYTDSCVDRSTSGCTSTKVLVTVSEPPLTGDDLADDEKNPEKAYARVGDAPMANAVYTATGLRTDYGHKAGHISASFGLGAVTARLGYTSKDSNDPADKMKEKTTFFGMNGSIGDTGMDWRAWGRNVEGHDGKESSPWGAGVGKALGGGAYAWIEHRNKDNGDSGNTFIALNVDF